MLRGTRVRAGQEVRSRSSQSRGAPRRWWRCDPRACPRPPRERETHPRGRCRGRPRGGQWEPRGRGRRLGRDGPRGPAGSRRSHRRQRGPWGAARCGQGSAEPPILLSPGAGRDTQDKDGICARPQRVNFAAAGPTLVVHFGDYSLCWGDLWLHWCRHVGKAQGSEASLRDSHCQAGRRHCHRAGRMPSLSRGEQDSIPPWRSDRGTRPPRRRWQLVCTASRSLCCELG